MTMANCFFASGPSIFGRKKNELNGAHLTFGVYNVRMLTFFILFDYNNSPHNKNVAQQIIYDNRVLSRG